MKVIFLETDELSLLHFFKNENIHLLNKKNDYSNGFLVIPIINDNISGMFTILDENCNSICNYIFSKENRIEILGEIKRNFVSVLGEDFKEKFFNQPLLDLESFDFVISKIKSNFNDFNDFSLEIDYLLEKEIEFQKKLELKMIENEKINILKKDYINIEGSEHTKSQLNIKEIGLISGCDVWIASNDKNKNHRGNFLFENTIEEIPNFDLNQDVKKRISLIDTIWFENDYPVCAFETETTTTVYSGILRMADLLTVMPNPKMKLYIVAPLSRKDKVIKEMNRPVFKSIGITDFCYYVPLENLSDLLKKIRGLNGHIKHSIIDSIAIDPKNYQ